MVKKLNPNQVAIPSGDEDDVKEFIDRDYLIRSGLCPNGHGLMSEGHGEQECPVCRFTTNVLAERPRRSH